MAGGSRRIGEDVGECPTDQRRRVFDQDDEGSLRIAALVLAKPRIKISPCQRANAFGPRCCGNRLRPRQEPSHDHEIQPRETRRRPDDTVPT